MDDVVPSSPIQGALSFSQGSSSCFFVLGG
jgi:hypothetical protein